MKRIGLILSFVVATACAYGKPPSLPVPVPLPAPSSPDVVVVGLRVLTVNNEPINGATVTACGRTLPTRTDGRWVEEFRPVVTSCRAVVSASGFVTVEQDIQSGVETAVVLARNPFSAPDVRIEGRRFIVGGRPLNIAIGSSFALKVPREQRRAVYAQVRAERYDGIRILAGRLTWADQSSADALRLLPEALDDAAEFGLIAMVTAVTDSADGDGEAFDTYEHVSVVAARLIGRRGLVAECANEPYHKTQSKRIKDDHFAFARVCGAAFDAAGIPWAYGAPEFDELQKKDPNCDDRVQQCELHFPWPVGKYVTIHQDRSRDVLNRARRVREQLQVSEFLGLPVFNSEPTAAGAGRESDTAFFSALGALSEALSVSVCLHAQNGLFTKPWDKDELEAARAMRSAMLDVRSITGGAAWSYQNVGHGNSPFEKAEFECEGGGCGSIVRAYAASDGSKAVAVVLHRSRDFIASDVQLKADWRLDGLFRRPNVTIGTAVR